MPRPSMWEYNSLPFCGRLNSKWIAMQELAIYVYVIYVPGRLQSHAI